jgi:hypothetical protein
MQTTISIEVSSAGDIATNARCGMASTLLIFGDSVEIRFMFPSAIVPNRDCSPGNGDITVPI